MCIRDRWLSLLGRLPWYVSSHKLSINEAPDCFSHAISYHYLRPLKRWIQDNASPKPHYRNIYLGCRRLRSRKSTSADLYRLKLCEKHPDVSCPSDPTLLSLPSSAAGQHPLQNKRSFLPRRWNAHRLEQPVHQQHRLYNEMGQPIKRRRQTLSNMGHMPRLLSHHVYSQWTEG